MVLQFGPVIYNVSKFPFPPELRRRLEHLFGTPELSDGDWPSTLVSGLLMETRPVASDNTVPHFTRTEDGSLCFVGPRSRSVIRDDNVKLLLSEELDADAFFNELRLAIGASSAALLVESGAGIVLHASSVAGPRGALVFTGPSGAGKSTLAKHWDMDAFMADDITILVEAAGRWLAGGNTPLVRRIRELDRLILISQGDETVLNEPLPQHVALKELISNTILWPGEPTLATRLLQHLERLLGAVSVQRLSVCLEKDLRSRVESQL